MRPLRLSQRLLRPLSAPPFVFGLALAFSAPIPGWLTLAVAHTHGSAALPFVALAPLALAPLLLRLVPWPARTSIACALFLATLAPFVYFIASWSLHLPIVKGSGLPGAARVPQDIESALVFSLFGIPLLAAPLIALVSSRFRPRVDAALRALACATTLALGALTFVVASRASAKSTPANYIASFPIDSALKPCWNDHPSHDWHIDDTTSSIRLGDVLIRRTCFRETGETEVLMPNRAIPVWLPRLNRRASVTLLARHDYARDLWFLEAHPHKSSDQVIAFDAHGRPVDTAPAALAHTPGLGPPSSWSIGALLSSSSPSCSSSAPASFAARSGPTSTCRKPAKASSTAAAGSTSKTARPPCVLRPWAFLPAS